MHDNGAALAERCKTSMAFLLCGIRGSFGHVLVDADYAYVRGNEYIYSNLDSGLTRRASLDLVMTS